MSQSPDSPPKPTADDALPPVLAPSMGFIVQLFFVPMMIVLIIVLVWLMFGWLAHKGDDPRSLVSDLNNPGKHRWQIAEKLASELRGSHNDQLKHNHRVTADLAGLLQDALDAGKAGSDDDLKLRIFLCRVLGEFYVADGLPVLIEAATIQRTPEDTDVRRSALEAIAILAVNVGVVELLKNENLMPALLKAAERGEPPRDELRSTAAYALGVIGNQQALDRIAAMCSDAAVNVRFNAATGLARNGDERAIRVLLQMLNPDNPSVVASEEEPFGILWKRTQVIMNGLEATEQLAAKNSRADLSELIEAVDKLRRADLDQNIRKIIRIRAKEVFNRLQKRERAAAK